MILISTRLVRNPSSNSLPRDQILPPVLMMTKSSQNQYRPQDLLRVLYKGALTRPVLQRRMIRQEGLPLN